MVATRPNPSMVNQALLLQRESVPGVAETDAMQRVLGIKSIPGFNVEGEDFKASGYKVNTSRVTNTEEGSPTVEAVQDFNGFTWLFCGGFGAPESGPVDSEATTPLAHLHEYTLNPSDPDFLASFTAIWGTPQRAVQMLNYLFNSLSLTISRNSVSIESTAMSREPELGAAYPEAGIVEVPSVPVAARTWDFYLDDSWEDLGTTKLLAAYEGEFGWGDKYVPDYVVNSEIQSYQSVLEAEDTDYTGTLRVGFDATAETLYDTYKAGAVKFMRLACSGPTIENDTPYSAEIDLCLRIVNPGEFGAAPNSPAVTLPFEFQFTVDPASGNAAAARLVNTVASL